MAAIDATFVGEFYDKITRTYYKSATMVGQFFLSDVGIGGGPVFPPSGGGGPVDPGYGKPGPIDPGYGVRPPVDPGYGVRPPVDPGYGVRPPVDPGYGVPGGEHPMPPIFYPPNVPPSLTPPQQPNPGDPVTPVPPPEGSQGWPVQPITPPPYIVVAYPGIGPVTVPQPLTAQPKPA